MYLGPWVFLRFFLVCFIVFSKCRCLDGAIPILGVWQGLIRYLATNRGYNEIQSRFVRSCKVSCTCRACTRLAVHEHFLYDSDYHIHIHKTIRTNGDMHVGFYYYIIIVTEKIFSHKFNSWQPGTISLLECPCVGSNSDRVNNI